MAITNYGELKTAVANWLARSNLTAQIPDFISLAEEKIHNGDALFGLQPLRVNEMLTTTTLSVTDGAATVPADFLAMQQARIPNAVPVQLEYLTPGDFWTWDFVTDSGVPTHYTIQGSTLRLQPTGASEVTISYYAKLDAMSADGDANWLLTSHPSVYLYGACVEGFGYVRDDAQQANMQQRFISAVNALNGADKEGDAADGALVMRVRSVS